MNKPLSYGTFLLRYPNASRIERCQAIKKFYDYIKDPQLNSNNLDLSEQNPEKVPGYGEFLKNNPNATREERRIAISKFYDSIK